VGNALDDWLAGGLSGKSDRTVELYRHSVKPLRERLADVRLKDLTAGDVQETLDALAERFSTRSLQIIRNCLERAIRHAEIRDLIGRNVAALVSHLDLISGTAGLTACLLPHWRANELELSNSLTPARSGSHVKASGRVPIGALS